MPIIIIPTPPVNKLAVAPLSFVNIFVPLLKTEFF